MKISRIMWYAGTVLTSLAMLAGSTTAATQQQARTLDVRTTAANLSGRALAREAVTMDSNNIQAPK